jgi:endonuclease G
MLTRCLLRRSKNELFQPRRMTIRSSSFWQNQKTTESRHPFVVPTMMTLSVISATLIHRNDDQEWNSFHIANGLHLTSCERINHQPSSMSVQVDDMWLLSPTLPYRIIRPNPHLEIAFCCRTRNPIYVLEKNLQPQDRRRRKRRPHFFEESSIRKDLRSQLGQYKYSGWDRGHLAPAADFAGNEQQQTYNLCNASPQDPHMNRAIWSRLEEWIRTAVIIHHPEEGSEVHVVTGPLWLPVRQLDTKKFEYGFQGIGQPPALVSVPTHFFKVVVVVSQNQIKKFACFVIANRPDNKDADSDGSNKIISLQNYLVPWTDLETVTGLQFFTNLVDDEWRQMADTLTLDEQQHSPPKTFLLGNQADAQPIKKRKRRNYKHLQHLCKGGNCKIQS